MTLCLCLLANEAWSADSESLFDRPDAAAGPTTVRVALYVIDIISINSERRSFNADFVLRLRWQDPRLAQKGERFALNEIWDPRLGIFNERNSETRFEEIAEILQDGTIQYSQRYQGEFSADLDFRDFPYDVQDLPITLISFGYSPDEVSLEFDSAGSVENLSVSGWSLEVQPGKIDTISADLFLGSQESVLRPRAQFTIKAERNVSYFRWSVLIPLCIVIFLSWAVFWIDPTQISPQIGVSATSILTVVAFLIRLDGMLPPVSYLTQLDKFVYFSLLLVFLAYIEALGSSWFASTDKGIAVARQMDKWSRVLFPATFAVLVLNYWVF